MSDRSDRERYGELARRLCAAYQSRQMGLASVDYTLKTYVNNGEIGEYWIALAKRVSQEMADSVANLLKT
jgi:hypothetical protein